MSTMIKELHRINLALSEIDSDKNKVIGFISINNNFERRTVIANLSMMYADAGQKTLLFDADFSNNLYKNIFNLKNDLGLSKFLLQSDLTFEDVIHPTMNNSLFVVPSGIVDSDDSNYLLTSPKIKDILEESQSKFEHVLVDIRYTENSGDQFMLMNQCDLLVLIENPENVKKKTINRFLNKMIINDIKIAGYINVKK